MPGFNRWLTGKNRQINRDRGVYGTPMETDYAGPEINEEAMEGERQGRRRSGGGRGFSFRPAKVGTGYGVRAKYRGGFGRFG
jgi:hypothetical protein